MTYAEIVFQVGGWVVAGVGTLGMFLVSRALKRQEKTEEKNEARHIALDARQDDFATELSEMEKKLLEHKLDVAMNYVDKESYQRLEHKMDSVASSIKSEMKEEVAKLNAQMEKLPQQLATFLKG